MLTVRGLSVLDTITTAVLSYGIYEYVVVYFMQPVEKFLAIPV